VSLPIIAAVKSPDTASTKLAGVGELLVKRQEVVAGDRIDGGLVARRFKK